MSSEKSFETRIHPVGNGRLRRSGRGRPAGRGTKPGGRTALRPSGPGLGGRPGRRRRAGGDRGGARRGPGRGQDARDRELLLLRRRRRLDDGDGDQPDAAGQEAALRGPRAPHREDRGLRRPGPQHRRRERPRAVGQRRIPQGRHPRRARGGGGEVPGPHQGRGRRHGRQPDHRRRGRDEARPDGHPGQGRRRLYGRRRRGLFLRGGDLDRSQEPDAHDARTGPGQRGQDPQRRRHLQSDPGRTESAPAHPLGLPRDPADRSQLELVHQPFRNGRHGAPRRHRSDRADQGRMPEPAPGPPDGPGSARIGQSRREPDRMGRAPGRRSASGRAAGSRASTS